MPVHLVEGLLKVDKEEASFVSQLEDPRDALGSSLTTLEPVLIEASLQEL